MKFFGMDSKPRYLDMEGTKYPPALAPEILHQAKNYRPGKEDVLVVTYPKCGTTWTLQIVVLILRRGKPPKTTEEYFSCMPYLESSTLEQMKEMSKPGCIKTHLLFDPKTYSPDAKYIYVARHPADCVVSFYHHTRYFPSYHYTNGSLDTFFDLFIKGEVDYNDYFDHLLCWYEHRNLPNVLFLTYESMKKDHSSNVLKIAKFLGKEYYDDLIANGGLLLDKVLYYSSLGYMKRVVNGFFKEAFTCPVMVMDNHDSSEKKKYVELLQEAKKTGHESIGDFIRKGEVGEGELTLSKEQMLRLNRRILEKTAQSDVMNLWKDT